jgi:WD40 repeat protein
MQADSESTPSSNDMGNLRDICFDCLGERVAGASSAGVFIWSHSASTFTAARATHISGADATSVSWGAPEHGSPLVCGNIDGSIFVWQPNFRVESDGVEAFSRLDPSFRVAANGRTISSVRFAPVIAGGSSSSSSSSSRFAAGGDDGHVRIYESVFTASGAAHVVANERGEGEGGGGGWQLTQEFETGAGAVMTLAWAPGIDKDAPLLAVACEKSISMWSLTTTLKLSSWVHVADLLGIATPAITLAWAPRAGRSTLLLASAGGSGKIALWRVASEGAPMFHQTSSLNGEGAALYVQHAPAATLAITPLTLIECGGGDVGGGVDCVAFSFEGALVASMRGIENRLTFREGPGGVWMQE